MKKNKLAKVLISLMIVISIVISPLTYKSAFAKTADKTPPLISKVKVSNISSKGYRITCTVTDNVGVTKVYVPTWTKSKGQDDLVWHVATIKGKTASFYVKTSEHNNESGIYYSHIYAYDKAGNVTGNSSLGAIKVPVNKNEVDFSYLQKKYPNNSIWNGSYKGKAWQCHGFALTLGDSISGKDPTKWKRVYNLNSLKSGDIIRCSRPHTIMVTKVSGNTITYVDCNWVGKNKVRWGQTIQRSKITSKFGSLQYVLVRP